MPWRRSTGYPWNFASGPIPDGDANIRAYVASENKSILSKIFDAFEETAYEYLNGRVMDGHFTLLSRATTSSTDVILEPSVTDAIQRHVLDYRAHMPAIEAAGEDPSRGIILAGPPGTENIHQPLDSLSSTRCHGRCRFVNDFRAMVFGRS